MAREIWVQSPVESYQRLKKWYLMPPCLTLSIIRYGSRVKWSNPGKGVAPSPTPRCSKLSKREPSTMVANFTYLLISYYIYVAGARETDEFMPFLRGLVWREMLTTSSRIWTWVVKSISYDCNHYSTSVSSIKVWGNTA